MIINCWFWNRFWFLVKSWYIIIFGTFSYILPFHWQYYWRLKGLFKIGVFQRIKKTEEGAYLPVLWNNRIPVQTSYGPALWNPRSRRIISSLTYSPYVLIEWLQLAKSARSKPSTKICFYRIKKSLDVCKIVKL